MGYFKDAEIMVVDELNAMARGAVVAIAPMLAAEYCDESAADLVEIWDGCSMDVEEEARADFNPMCSDCKRFDVYYANRLMNEVAGFIAISMENDW